MENISIDTAQNVAIDYELASVGDRMLAQIIDYAIIYGYIIAYIYIGREILPELFETVPVILVAVLPITLYHLAFEVFNNGQSPGKIIRKIRVVQVDGSQPSVASFLLRWLLGMIEITSNNGSIALATILLNKHGQRLGDIAAGTTVIKLREEVTLGETIYARVPKDYTPVFTQAKFMDDETARIARTVVNTFYQNDVDKTRMDLIATTFAEALKNKLGVVSDFGPISFIDTILKDYMFYHGEAV